VLAGNRERESPARNAEVTVGTSRRFPTPRKPKSMVRATRSQVSPSEEARAKTAGTTHRRARRERPTRRRADPRAPRIPSGPASR